MSVWNSANFVLTNIGSEIFGKIEAGMGSIVVTKVVSGAEYTNPANLKTLTNINQAKQELLIRSSDYSATLKASTIVAELTNVTLQESYPLYKLGVFVTHPDYVGDQLYMVAQCDQGTQDTIPPATNPFSTTFSFILAHSDASTVVVNVVQAGAASQADLLALREIVINEKQDKLTPTNLLPVDSGGTGAGNAAQALANLGGMNLNGNCGYDDGGVQNRWAVLAEYVMTAQSGEDAKFSEQLRVSSVHSSSSQTIPATFDLTITSNHTSGGTNTLIMEASTYLPTHLRLVAVVAIAGNVATIKICVSHLTANSRTRISSFGGAFVGTTQSFKGIVTDVMAIDILPSGSVKDPAIFEDKITPIVLSANRPTTVGNRYLWLQLLEEDLSPTYLLIDSEHEEMYKALMQTTGSTANLENVKDDFEGSNPGDIIARFGDNII